MKKIIILFLTITLSLSRLLAYTFENNNSIGNGGVSNLVTSGASYSFNGDNFFTNSATIYGGAIYFDLSSGIYFTNNNFLFNDAGLDGGAIYFKDSYNINLYNNSFISNSAINYGGSLFFTNSININLTGNRFLSNYANYLGGAITFTNSHQITLAENIFNNNTGGFDAGAIYFRNSTNIYLYNNIFASNYSSGDGGAVFLWGATNINFTSNNFISNTTSIDGGAIHLLDTFNVSIMNSGFVNNNAANNGGAVSLSRGIDVKILDGVFNENSTRNGNGGALSIVDFFDVSIVSNSFSENTTIGNGGAVYLNNLDEAVIDGSLFKENYSGANGGALSLMVTNSASIKDSQFINNTADSDGGAVYTSGISLIGFGGYGISNIAFINTLFSGNTSLSFIGGGGGLAFGVNVIFSRIDNSVFENNTATAYGGAIYANINRLEIHNSILKNNTAGINGGAISLTGSGIGGASAVTNTIAISTSNSELFVWSGNTANGKPNSIYFGGLGNAKVELDMGQNTVFRLEDPIYVVRTTSSSGIGSFHMEKIGKGKFQISGYNSISSSTAILDIIDGAIEVINGGVFDFSGTLINNITIGANADLGIILNTNGNAIFIGNSIDSTIQILSKKETLINLERYTKINENIVFPIASNMTTVTINNGIAVNNALYRYNLNLNNNDIVMELVRVHAKEIMPGINDYLSNVLDNYMGGNRLIESILKTSNPSVAQNSLITASELTKSAGILYANRLISSAVDYELMYAINSKQALDQSASMFGNIPISLWFTPLVLFGEYSDNVTSDGLKGGNNVNSYGGMVAADVALPVAINMRMGIAGYFGLGFSKSTGVYVNTVNNLMYFGGSVYYNLSAKNMRFNTAISWIGMNNNINQVFGEDSYKEELKTTFLSHNINASFIFSYDFVFIKNLYFSPFIGGTYTFYYQPDFEAKNEGDIIFSTKNAMRHSIILPIGISLSYNFLFSGKHIITPSIRLNLNIAAYDSMLKAKWGIPTSLSGLNLTEGEIIVKDEVGLIDLNFNLSWRRRNIMVYGDYNLRLFSSRISHFISAGVRCFF